MAEIGSGNGSGYPGVIDADATVEVNSPSTNKTLARADVPNDTAAGVIAVQTELGTDPAGSLADVKTFLQTEHGTDGTHQKSAFSVHKNGSDQSITQSTLTKVTWSTEDYDKNNKFASDKYTPPSGKYLLIANIWYKATLEADKDYEVHIYKNGSSYKMVDYNFHSTTDPQFSPKIITLVDADGDDYFEVYTQHNNTGAESVDGDSTKTFFQGFKVG